MRESYCYIELAGNKKRNHYVFGQRIFKGYQWHDVYERILEVKDNIYTELKDYLYVIEN